MLVFSDVGYQNTQIKRRNYKEKVTKMGTVIVAIGFIGHHPDHGSARKAGFRPPHLYGWGGLG
jgi:hypothetical protein